MTIKCRFCRKPMFCSETMNDRNEGVITGLFTCSCKGFIENAKKQRDFELKKDLKISEDKRFNKERLRRRWQQ